VELTYVEQIRSLGEFDLAELAGIYGDEHEVN
jgi:hypothetical protein